MHKALLLSFMLAFSMRHDAHSSELGNLFGLETEHPSRLASGEILAAIQTLIEGLRQRELEESDGSKFLLEAAAQISDAASMMRSIQIPDQENYLIDSERLSRLNSTQRNTYNAIIAGRTIQTPLRISELYEIFISESTVLSKKINELSNARADETILASLSETLSKYLIFGSAVSILANPKPPITP